MWDMRLFDGGIDKERWRVLYVRLLEEFWDTSGLHNGSVGPAVHVWDTSDMHSVGLSVHGKGRGFSREF